MGHVFTSAAHEPDTTDFLMRGSGDSWAIAGCNAWAVREGDEAAANYEPSDLLPAGWIPYVCDPEVQGAIDCQSMRTGARTQSSLFSPTNSGLSILDPGKDTSRRGRWTIRTAEGKPVDQFSEETSTSGKYSLMLPSGYAEITSHPHKTSARSAIGQLSEF